MKIKFGINGFGRIGRGILRQFLKQSDSILEIGAINDLSPPQTLAHLFKHDSVHGNYPGEVRAHLNALEIDGSLIPIITSRDPSESQWKESGVQIVMECTGKFTSREKSKGHFKGGAKKVIISAPGKDADLTVVMGVNEDSYNPTEHHILSNASCTTNCLAPVVKVLHENFTIRRGFMNTVHSYTNDQRILDASHSDLRRARAGACSQIPTTTGAARAIGIVIPELKGKVDGLSIRVPTPNVSLVDFVCEVEKPTTVEEVNATLRKASEGFLKGILAYSEEPLVSVDYIGNPASATIDSLLTAVIDQTLLKVIAWYDNETGFSERMIELGEFIAKQM